VGFMVVVLYYVTRVVVSVVKNSTKGYKILLSFYFWRGVIEKIQEITKEDNKDENKKGEKTEQGDETSKEDEAEKAEENVNGSPIPKKKTRSSNKVQPLSGDVKCIQQLSAGAEGEGSILC
jgi:hypothetical protein